MPDQAHPTIVHKVFEVWVMFFGLGLFALTCLSSVPVFCLIYLLVPIKHRRRLSRLVVFYGFHAYARVLHYTCAIRSDLSALDELRTERSLIVIANHPSLLDAVYLFSRSPNASCVMKAALLRNILYGIGARMAGYVSNESLQTIVAQGCKILEEGAHFIIFPEATRTVDFPLNDLTGAFALMSKRANVPVQTVFLEYSSPYLGKRWGLMRRPKLPLLCTARLGKRFPPPKKTEEMVSTIEQYYRRELRSMSNKEAA